MAAECKNGRLMLFLQLSLKANNDLKKIAKAQWHR
jgi:hypothetical protein